MLIIINPFTHVTNSKYLLIAHQTISDSSRCAALAWLVKSRSLHTVGCALSLRFPIQHPPLRQQKLAEEWLMLRECMSPKSRAEKYHADMNVRLKS